MLGSWVSVEINRPEELCSRDEGSITNSRDVSCFFSMDYAYRNE